MRVAFVYRNLGRARSLERDSVLLVEGLLRKGVEVHCYCDPLKREADVPGVSFHDVPALVRSHSRLGYPVERLSFAARATRALRRDRSKYDIVHVLGVAAWEHDVVSVPAVTVAEQRRWPKQAGRDYTAARTRAFLAPVLRPEIGVMRAIERMQFRPGRFLRATAVTEQVRDDLVAVHGVSAEDIDIVPPPAEISRFQSATNGDLRRRIGAAPDADILLFIGHAFERKGLADAIAALKAVRPGAHLVVVGEGDPEIYRRQAVSEGVAERVHFIGGTAEPERFMAGADVLVLPTRHDPWGIPIVEAMATGVPVLTTEVAGAAAVVRRARAGVVVPSSSPAGLAAALGRLLDDPTERKAMGERGRAAAVEYGVEAHVDAVLLTYERALEAKRRS